MNDRDPSPGSLASPLFTAEGEWDEVADLEWGEEFHYVEGYRRAARTVVSSAETTYDLDQFVYPVVYLYRHAVELLLKRLIAHGRVPPRTHDLHRLWLLARETIENEGVGITGPVLTLAEARIDELHAKHRTATEFRYPAKERRKVGINLTVFAARAEALCELLDGWDTAIHEVRGWRREARGEGCGPPADRGKRDCSP